MASGNDFFDRQDAEDRRTRVAAATVENERVRALEAEADAARRERGKIFSARTNAMLLTEQYLAAGVEPPALDAAGAPTCSLSMLLSIGWRIEEYENEVSGEVRRALMRPSAVPQARRARGRNDEQGS